MKKTLILFVSLFVGLVSGLGLPLSAGAAPAGTFPPPPAEVRLDTAPALFTSLEATEAANVSVVRDVQVVRWRQVGIDRNLLARSADTSSGLPAIGRIISLNLFDDTEYVAEASRIEQIARGVKWVGRLRGVNRSQVIFTLRGDEVFGSVSMPGKSFQLRYVSNGIHEIQELNTSIFSQDRVSPDRLPPGVLEQRSGQYFTASTVALADGTLVEETIINGPPEPPPGFEVERRAVSLPEPNTAGASTLQVPAFDWVFGCSSVSGAMIAGYYDRTGYPNMYTGPTNGGVMPMDNSSWPTWSDGYKTYPNLPLAASHNGVDGRTTRGSIDDYWVQYDSSVTDPYITGGWTQHTWGDAIGDYMKTSQSAYKNKDGSTAFWTYNTLPDRLTCAEMVTQGITNDGTVGRKLFYEARGYTVTDCYNQKTDNNVSGGFSFANYMAEIDAGRPVMLNLEGHTIAGVGYESATNTVYLHDTWDYQNHSMTWGTSYDGMKLLSVSIVNLTGGSTTKTITVTAPASNASWTVGSTQTVSWTSTGSISAVDIWLNNSGSWVELAKNVSNTGSKSITVPDSTGTNCRVYVYDHSDQNVYGVNPGAFSNVASAGKSIHVTSPPAGATWAVGTSQTVSWTWTGAISAVEIWLWNNGSWTQLVSNVSNTGSKTITVPNSPGTNCWIYVSEQSNYNVNGWNPGAFRIAANVAKSISVTAPSAGASWTVGTSQKVSWTWTGSISAVEIWLWNNGNWLQLASNVSNTGSKTITVPSSTGTNCWIYVSEQSNYNVFGWNPGAFTIVASAAKSIHVTSPQAGATWTAGSSQTVSWTWTGAISAVEIWLWNNGNWTQLASNVSNSGSKSITVPNSTGTNCWIYVSEQSNYNVFGWNPGPFSIVGGGGFNSQFNGNAENWFYLSSTPEWLINSSYYYTYGASGVFASTYYGRISDGSATFTNFDYQARVWRYGCDTCSAGIIVRGVPTPLGSGNRWNSGYGFYYSRSGEYTLGTYKDGAWTTLVNWSAHSAINTGDNWNVLRARANGTTVDFYINGTAVARVTSSVLPTAGKVGLALFSDTSSGNSLWADWATLSTLGASATMDAWPSIIVDDSVPRAANSSDLGIGLESAILPPPKSAAGVEKTAK